MINEKILVSSDTSERPDKMKIALAIRDAVRENNDLSCSLLDNNIINDCSSCTLNFICKKIDETSEDYMKNITTLINDFKF